MSGEMALWAVRQDIKDPIAKLVLVALCEHCNEVGECYPNHETLSDYVRRSKVYIREKIRLLEADGWLKRTKRFGPNKRQTSNLYTINEDRGETRKAYHARKSLEAEERASKRSKTKSSGDGGASPRSSGDAMAAGGRDARQAPVSVMPGKQAMNNKDKKVAPDGAVSKISPEEAPPAAAPCPPPTPANAAPPNWRNRLIQYRKRGIWAKNWGPPMHAPGCLVPPDLVREWDATQGKAFVEEEQKPAWQGRKKRDWQQAGNATIN